MAIKAWQPSNTASFVLVLYYLILLTCYVSPSLIYFTIRVGELCTTHPP